MPIFQEDIDHTRPARGELQPSRRPPTRHAPLGSRRLSEESLPVELCEGPIPDSPEQRPKTPESQNGSHMIDRSVLIERIKRGESPSWIPDRHVGHLVTSEQPSKILTTSQVESNIQHSTAPTASQTSPEPLNLLPSPEISPEKNRPVSPIPDCLHDGLGIERPRSALHSGDFTHDEAPPSSRDPVRQQPQSRYPQDHLSVDMAWMGTSPPRPSMSVDRHSAFAEPSSSLKSILSSSFSSTFAYQLPTSPLAQSITNEDHDGFAMPFRESGFLSDRMDFSRGSYDETSPFSSPLRLSRSHGRHSFRREATFPYQAHQPRRSSGSGMSFLHPGSSPQRPIARSRRPSLGSDSSPSLHASMVGSYEESILQGRMSTTPSKPFDFMAQIGVLGKGKCKSRLRCPAHVTLPFPAVFYSYSSTSAARSQSNDGPSPYVGQIDLENGLPNPDVEAQKRRTLRRQHAHSSDMDIDMLLDGPLHADDKVDSATSLKAPPGGSYRIPEKGQIQIIVKNQNKTALKLFLVPYDLTGMPPGTKTFIRQRSYSHGPIIDNLPNLSASAAAVAMGRPTLRYLVHLHVCSPSKGRFYLYKSIRIVFANRVPEGKEKLRNETTCPEPRFTPYKPIRQMHPPISSSYSRSGATLAAEKAYRRRSLGIPTSSEAQRTPFSASALGSLNPPQQRRFSNPRGGFRGSGNLHPIEPVSFRFPARRDSDASDIRLTVDDVDGPPHSPSRPSTKDSAWGYEKLSRGDVGYGGNAFAGTLGDAASGGSDEAGSPSGAEGLLSQRLRSLGVDKARPYSLPPS
ncbi:hypothetical protein LLEC1_01081 [Akanthomyces lecanii]|uniref:Atos-like conserved domain-containing protein n=1 Tax=Cordyceps confragosa TaxID=2714763 RepID=A0A179ICU4_CORDF|nr:hypothetical protein LLEC1_01081 [Akanthomyces lecanii]